MRIEDELADAMRNFRKVEAMRKQLAQLPPAVHGGRIFGGFNPLGTRTARYSSSRPNLQNWHKASRDPRARALIRGNVLVAVDLDSIQMRIIAYLTRDPALLETFAANGDVHELTASGAGVDRDTGKFLNYSMSFGIGAPKLAFALDTSLEEAQRIKRAFYATYPSMRTTEAQLSRQAIRTGYVETLLGRRLWVPADKSYTALNTLVQGIEADLVKTAVVELHALATPMIATIHDELLAESPPDRAEEVGEQIRVALTRSLPQIREVVELRAVPHIAERWSECK